MQRGKHSGGMAFCLRAGVGLQVLQQAAGINTVMYFTPVILELAGIHDKRTALLVRAHPASVWHGLSTYPKPSTLNSSCNPTGGPR